MTGAHHRANIFFKKKKKFFFFLPVAGLSLTTPGSRPPGRRRPSGTSLAAWRTSGSSSSPSLVPSRIPATSASRSARPAASSRSLAIAAASSSSVSGAPLRVMPGLAVKLGDEQPVSPAGAYRSRVLVSSNLQGERATAPLRLGLELTTGTRRTASYKGERGRAGAPSGWGGLAGRRPGTSGGRGMDRGVSPGRACWRQSHNRGTGENRSPGNQSCRKKMVISGSGRGWLST